MTDARTLDIPAVNDTTRLSALSVPTVAPDTHEVTITAENETYAGPVTRVDTYSDSVDVERVVQFRLTEGHQPQDGWELWRGYFVEEPEGIYRVTIQESQIDESGKRSMHLSGPDAIDIR